VKIGLSTGYVLADDDFRGLEKLALKDDREAYLPRASSILWIGTEQLNPFLWCIPETSR